MNGMVRMEHIELKIDYVQENSIAVKKGILILKSKGCVNLVH